MHLRPSTVFTAVTKRKTVRAWTDASGVERGLAAVVEVDGVVHYTSIVLSLANGLKTIE